MLSNKDLIEIERYIYLPLLLIVLERDYTLFEEGPFKLKAPYLHMIESAKKLIEKDLVEVKAKLKSMKIKVVRGERDDLFTEYHFYIGNYVDKRRYSNVRLKNYSEKLLEEYIRKSKDVS